MSRLITVQQDRPFIGQIERGFDFPGYHFSPTGLRVAKKTIANFIEKASRLYEQKSERCFNHSTGAINSMYLKDRLGDFETDCRNGLNG